ncbi:MAG: hypothetical protein M4579_002348 [Chaenotheca gracillima]|nr:MAG: hypothetical protein M4579_002348 [Chaenotheca gracillima]
MDDQVAAFTGVTGCGTEKAEQYLRISEGNLEHAVQLFFESGGLDLDDQAAAAASAAPSQPPPPPSLRPQPPTGRASNEPIEIDSDDEFTSAGPDPDAGFASNRSRTQAGGATEDDEAMARRMQEELYGNVGGGGIPTDVDADGVRAPMARTTETLVGPNSNWESDDPDQMQAAITDHMASFRQRSRGGEMSDYIGAQLEETHAGMIGRAGIFNQRPSRNVWDDEQSPRRDTHQRALAAATGGASEQSSKASLLAELYRPPAELASLLPWDAARQQGKTEQKWILVNVQDPAVFDCQVLNRDIWKNSQIQETVKEHFIFMQYNKDDPRGNQYIQYYFQAKDSQDAYPHIAIVDPRTGEQVKVWSGPPVPKAMEFLMQLHEFLDRYSLDLNAKNPVAKRKSEKPNVDVDRMTEEEMLEMALQNSLDNNGGPREEDPDNLTRSTLLDAKGKGKATQTSEGEPMDTDSAPGDHPPAAAEPDVISPFTSISSTHPHEEPDADPATTTRIQFRHSGGRIIRRFALTDPVRRLYEWLKAEPLEGKTGVEFELVCMGRNLMDSLEDTIEQAGLKNQTVMIELLED